MKNLNTEDGINIIMYILIDFSIIVAFKVPSVFSVGYFVGWWRN